jgi:hypothetical protein
MRRFVQEKITPGLEGGGVPPWKGWEYCALIKQAAGSSDMELGSLFLLAAQCARLDEKYEEEKQYRLRSLGHYLKAIEHGEIPQDSLYQSTYIIGELYRRTGDTWKSHEWYQKVLDMDVEHQRREFFVNLARQQMTAPRNFIEEEDERDAEGADKPGWLSRLKKLVGIKQIRY